jgi:hypothetical protein
MGAAGDGSSCGKERAPELRWRLIPDELSPPPNGGALPLLGMESDGDGRCGEVEELVRAVGGERGEEQEKGAEEHAARRRCGQETYSGGVHRPSSQVHRPHFSRLSFGFPFDSLLYTFLGFVSRSVNHRILVLGSDLIPGLDLRRLVAPPPVTSVCPSHVFVGGSRFLPWPLLHGKAS